MEFMQTCKPVSSKLTSLPSPGTFVKMEKLDIAPTLLARLQILFGFYVCPSVPVYVRIPSEIPLLQGGKPFTV